MPKNECKQLLRSIYAPLETRKNELVFLLRKASFDVSHGFYNGHYHKDDDGVYREDLYPIPVISVEGLCDIELDTDMLSVSTKMKKDDVLSYDIAKLGNYAVEVYGVEGYLNDFYTEGMTLAELKENIHRSEEREIGFSFLFPVETSSASLLSFIGFLQQEGFYY